MGAVTGFLSGAERDWARFEKYIRHAGKEEHYSPASIEKIVGEMRKKWETLNFDEPIVFDQRQVSEDIRERGITGHEALQYLVRAAVKASQKVARAQLQRAVGIIFRLVCELRSANEIIAAMKSMGLVDDGGEPPWVA